MTAWDYLVIYERVNSQDVEGEEPESSFEWSEWQWSNDKNFKRVVRNGTLTEILQFVGGDEWELVSSTAMTSQLTGEPGSRGSSSTVVRHTLRRAVTKRSKLAQIRRRQNDDVDRVLRDLGA